MFNVWKMSENDIGNECASGSGTRAPGIAYTRLSRNMTELNILINCTSTKPVDIKKLKVAQQITKRISREVNAILQLVNKKIEEFNEKQHKLSDCNMRERNSGNEGADSRNGTRKNFAKKKQSPLFRLRQSIYTSITHWKNVIAVAGAKDLKSAKFYMELTLNWNYINLERVNKKIKEFNENQVEFHRLVNGVEKYDVDTANQLRKYWQDAINGDQSASPKAKELIYESDAKMFVKMFKNQSEPNSN